MPGLREVIPEDFTDYSVLARGLEHQDAALYCLGAYTGVVPDDLFRQITVDYRAAFAKAFYKASPQATFCFLENKNIRSMEQK